MQSCPLAEPLWLPILAWLMLLWVTVRVPLLVVWFEAVEIVNAVALAIVLMVTLAVAVNVVAPLAVAAVVSVNAVAPETVEATVSLVGMPAPLMRVPAASHTGEAVVTVFAPAVVVPAKVLVLAPVPLMVMFTVSAAVDGVVTVVLPAVVLAVIVDERPVVLTHGLRVVLVPLS